MIITNNTSKRAAANNEESEFLLGSTSNSSDFTTEAPPPFSYSDYTDEAGSSSGFTATTPTELSSALTLAPSEPPPSFSLYEAEYFEDNSGNIISHDPHLNTDGEALYRFLLTKSEEAPVYRLHCRGTHSEERGGWVTHTAADGRQRSRYETRTETVTDFDFYIDIHIPTSERPVHWSVPDNEPAYRGGMSREVEHSVGKSGLQREAQKKYDQWIEERAISGRPPWITPSDSTIDGYYTQIPPLRSSKSLRQWADEYCASQKYLKEFTYKKVIYGWNIQQLETAIRAKILSTMYMGNLTVEFETRGSKIYIRPDNKLSRLLSNKWLKFLLWILFIFPFVWLFKRFHSRGGGQWEVCGGAYCMKKWVPVTGDEDEQDMAPSIAGGPARVQQTPNGIVKLIGYREGEWLRKWESTIICSVNGRYQSPIPINDIGTADSSHSMFPYLDGY